MAEANWKFPPGESAVAMVLYRDQIIVATTHMIWRVQGEQCIALEIVYEEPWHGGPRAPQRPQLIDPKLTDA